MRGMLLVLLSAVVHLAAAQSRAVEPSAVAPGERDLLAWLQRMHEASRQRAYIGTLVISSEGRISSARVWHVCDGREQRERVESLTGAPRSTFRRDEQVVTFSPQDRVAVSERRESMRLFPGLLRSVDTSIGQYYSVRTEGSDRVAGLDADVVHVLARDALRFGYRIWSEQRTGLVVKVQTLDAQDQVLEQAAFSELQLDAPVSKERLDRMMSDTAGYRVETPTLVKTTPQAEGWRLTQEVPGFREVSCYRRRETGAGDAMQLQWVFSDGLATVSLFIEAHNPRRHGAETLQHMGATHALSRRLAARGQTWWLTAVGEVPAPTLQRFLQAVDRTP